LARSIGLFDPNDAAALGGVFLLAAMDGRHAENAGAFFGGSTA